LLVIFAGGLIGFLAIAALVFDVGQDLLDWRTQRNVADAAALAGVRYMTEPTCAAASSIANCPAAYDAAHAVAAANGFGEGGRGTVTVFIPPQAGHNFAGENGFIEVNIETERTSFFAAVLGIFVRNVHALAVAGYASDVTLDFSLLAIAPDCDPQDPMRVHGSGTVTLGGLIHVNGECDGAMDVDGVGQLKAPECDVVGTVDYPTGKGGYVDCKVLNEGALSMNDPLYILDPPPFPGDAPDVEVIGGRMYDDDGDTFDDPPSIPQGCPGSVDKDGNPTEATAADPIGCSFPAPRYEVSCDSTLTGLPAGECGPVLRQDTCDVDPVTFEPILDPATCDPTPLADDGGWDEYRIHQGAYWGGLDFDTQVTVGALDASGVSACGVDKYCRKTRVYLDPGVYWIGGGGFKVTGEAEVISVDSAGSTTPGRGVHLYNTQSADACAAGMRRGCIGEFHAVGAQYWLYLYADDEGPYPGLLFFQDRDLCARFRIEGGDATTELGGTIYVPCGEVKINGGASNTYAVQIIAWEFDLGGSKPFSITYDPDLLFGIPVSGLVQ
jgi:hypothetical protein